MEYYLVGWRLMANLFYCCIDGGGSKTQIALFDGHGRRLGTTITGPTSLSINHIKPWDIIYKSLKDISRKWKIDRSFTPKMKSKNRLELLQGWSKAIKKTLSH